MDFVLSSVYFNFQCSQLQDVFKSQNAKNGAGQIGLRMFWGNLQVPISLSTSSCPKCIREPENVAHSAAYFVYLAGSVKEAKGLG